MGAEQPISTQVHREVANDARDLLAKPERFSQLPESKLNELQQYLRQEPRNAALTMHVNLFQQNNPRIAPVLVERLRSILKGTVTLKPTDKGIISAFLTDYAKKVANIKTGTVGSGTVAWEDL